MRYQKSSFLVRPNRYRLYAKLDQMWQKELIVKMNSKKNCTRADAAHAVKKVVDFRVENGKRYYKVKWESSWELEDNLQEYQKVVTEFWNFVSRVKNDKDQPNRKKPRLINTDIASKNTIQDGKIMGTLYNSNEKMQPASLENLTKLTEDSNAVMVKSEQGTPAGEPRPTMITPTSSSFPSNQQAFPTGESSSENKVDEDKDNTSTVSINAGESFIPDENDIALKWDNPYVNIVFFCRVCNAPQPFNNSDQLWKEHFINEHSLTNYTSMSPSSIEQQIDEKGYQYAPWIQKVEYLINKWGINQYVRIAFLCRICGKEQPPRYTGNWRNHNLSHRKHRPFICSHCSKTFRCKPELNRHLRLNHNIDDSETHICSICSNSFTRIYDLRKHLEEVHGKRKFHAITNLPRLQELQLTTCKTHNAICDTQVITSFSRIQQALSTSCEPHVVTTSSRINETQSISTSHAVKNIFPHEPYLTPAEEMQNVVKEKKIIDLPEDPLTPIINSPLAQSTPQQFICGECFITFKTLLDLSRHKAYIHKHPISVSHHRDGNDFREECYNFKNVDDLESHRVTHHSSDHLALIPHPPIPNPSIHLLSNLPISHPSITRHSIPTSQYLSNSDSTLTSDEDRKMRIHVCKICGKAFKRKYDLNRHTSKVHAIDFETAKKINEEPSDNDALLLISPPQSNEPQLQEAMSSGRFDEFPCTMVGHDDYNRDSSRTVMVLEEDPILLSDSQSILIDNNENKTIT